MTNKKLVCAIVFIIGISVTTVSFSQVTFNFGPSLGATVPIGDYAGSLDDFYSLNKFGSKIGGNFGATAKLVFPFITAHGFITYNVSSKSGNVNAGNIDLHRNIFQIGIGPEYDIKIPKSKLKPYAGVDFIMSIFSGRVNFSNIASDLDGEFDFNTATRYGLGLHAGVELKLPNFIVDLNAKASLLNLIKRDFTADTSRLGNYLNLNDNPDPLYNPGDIQHQIGNKRLISVFQLTISIIYKVSI